MSTPAGTFASRAEVPEGTVASTRVLLVECPDGRGLVHLITGILADHGANIVNNHEFVDRQTHRFFMRTEFAGGDLIEQVVSVLRAALPAPADVRVGRGGAYRLVVLATREHHCLAELLVRDMYGELGASIQAVISNHATLETLTTRFNLPFHHVPHEGVTREGHEQAVLEIVDLYAPDYIVLAKYMRVLSPVFVARYGGRILNIHHSFLPAFVGANPYRQAFERGVKIIGATAHFVTDGLDQGPIIAQAVSPVDHSDGPHEMARAGRDIEKIVLAKALKLVCEDRVCLSGSRAIVFE